jgi:hypothetical protein
VSVCYVSHGDLHRKCRTREADLTVEGWRIRAATVTYDKRTYVMMNSIHQLVLLMRSKGLPQDP